MILSIAFSTIVLLFVFYGFLGDWAYRHPWTLLVAGVIAAACGTVLKSTPIILKGLPNLAWRPEELELAALVVDPLLGGLAGGLVASAVIFKLQIMHAKAQIAAHEELQYTSEDVDQAQLHCQRVKEMKGSIPANEYEERDARASDALYRALNGKRAAEKRMRTVFVPGLGDVKRARSKRQRPE